MDEISNTFQILTMEYNKSKFFDLVSIFHHLFRTCISIKKPFEYCAFFLTINIFNNHEFKLIFITCKHLEWNLVLNILSKLYF